VRAAELLVFGQTLHAAELNAAQAEQGWTGHVTSEEAAGDFHFRAGPSQPSLSLSLERVRLTPDRWTSGGRRDLDSSSLPKLQVTSERLYLGSDDLGQLTLAATPEGQEVRLETLRLEGPSQTVRAHGRWVIEESRPRSELDLAASLLRH
jgi:uncharacterized protein YhdP